MAEWDILIGTKLPRKELHDRWGGGRYGGMEPAVEAESVFLFSNPSVGRAFGYNYDGWHDDGTFHYTGDGQLGDQLPTSGGNKALVDAPALGRTVRLFRSEGTETTYLGAFSLATDPPYYSDAAPDRELVVRKVLVFRLEPLGTVVHDDVDDAPRDTDAPEEIPVEAGDIDSYLVRHPDEPVTAVRREAQLVARYVAWLSNIGEEAVRHRIPVPGGGYLFTDVFNRTRQEVVEAKASAARLYVRAALGQILDYSRFLAHDSRAVLLPSVPSDDLVELLHTHGVAVIWEDGSTFPRRDP
ncbi:MAG: hypothetical protein ACR2KG_13400 [Nocardioidaceae bacterium]